MRLTTLLLSAFATLATAGIAQSQELSGMGANLFGNYFNFAKANLSAPPVSEITIGGLKVKLQGTRLADVQKRLGGTIMRAGEATWLCYHANDTNTWLMSNPLGGQEFVMMVAVETANRMPDGCEAAGEAFSLPEMGIPGLGAATADLKAAFGAANSGSKVTYRHDRPGGYADIAQYVGYMMKSGKVAGYGVGETSIPTQH
jgi:hypothetical protein